jgi:hypothetical protein
VIDSQANVEREAQQVRDDRRVRMLAGLAFAPRICEIVRGGLYLRNHLEVPGRQFLLGHAVREIRNRIAEYTAAFFNETLPSITRAEEIANVSQEWLRDVSPLYINASEHPDVELTEIRMSVVVDFLKMRNAFTPRYRTIFTGPIDEYFDFDMGRLAYRGQRRHHEFLPDIDQFQPVGQVNYPLKSQGDHIRVLEWKHMLEPPYGIRFRGTLLTWETPYSPGDPRDYEYPFPDAANRRLYTSYAERAAAIGAILFCGRLGEYRYYDMDQAIGRGLMLADSLRAQATDNRATFRSEQQN